MPTALRQYKALLRKDLRQEFRTKEMILSMVLYGVLVIVVFGVSLLFSQGGEQFTSAMGGLLWATIVFTSLLGLGRSFAIEQANGCINGLLLTPMDRGVIFLAKATANLIFLLIVEVIIVPVFLFFFAGPNALAPSTPLVLPALLLGSLGIAGIGTLLTSIASASRGKEVLLALLFVPVLFPLLYTCVAATSAAILGGSSLDGISVSFALAIGYDVVMILISWILYQFAISS